MSGAVRKIMIKNIAAINAENSRAGVGSAGIWTARTGMISCSPVVVALPEGYPLVERQVIYWPELKRERFLIGHHDPGPDMRNQEIRRDLDILAPSLRICSPGARAGRFAFWS